MDLSLFHFYHCIQINPDRKIKASRSTAEVNELVQRQIRPIVLKQKLPPNLRRAILACPLQAGNPTLQLFLLRSHH